MAVDSVGNTVFVADQSSNTIRTISSLGVVSTLAGRAGAGGYADGLATSAIFSSPTGVAIDSQNQVFVADQNNNAVRRVSTAGMVTTLAGGVSGFQDGRGTNAYFNSPQGVTVDLQGYVYVVDVNNYRVRKVTPYGNVMTLAGGSNGYMDGCGTAAYFGRMFGITVSADGTLYLADAGNNAVRKVTSSGWVSTLAGSGSYSAVDGIGTLAAFAQPFGIALDTSGNILVTEVLWYYWTPSHRIRIISSSALVVRTLAGTGLCSSADGRGTSAGFCYPYNLAVNANGDIYIADTGNNRIRVVGMGKRLLLACSLIVS